MKKGHYAVAVDIDNREDAARMADIAKQQDGHGFAYFGKWVSEQLS